MTYTEKGRRQVTALTPMRDSGSKGARLQNPALITILDEEIGGGGGGKGAFMQTNGGGTGDTWIGSGALRQIGGVS
jgi:hypothetical protein